MKEANINGGAGAGGKNRNKQASPYTVFAVVFKTIRV